MPMGFHVCRDPFSPIGWTRAERKCLSDRYLRRAISVAMMIILLLIERHQFLSKFPSLSAMIDA